MKLLPAGSQSSPIVISDDEDEIEFVSGHLLQLDSPSSSSSTRAHFQGPKKGPRNRARNLEKRSAKGKNPASVIELPKSRKRKREQSNTRHNAANSNQPPSMSTAAGASSVGKSKRSKQQERASRFQRENNALARRQIFDDEAFEQNSDPFSSTFLPMYSMTPIPPDLFSGGLMEACPPSLSSSEWVNSMARAAEPPDSIQTMPNYSWDYSVTSAVWNPLSQPHITDVAPTAQSSSSSSAPLPPKPASGAPSNSISGSLPKKPPPTNIIGMPRQRDRDGKRGGFKISHSTVFNSQPHITYPHAPDSSRTLIIEQLPKPCRSPQWIKSWSKNACGSHPVFYAIDSSSAKALLEFPSVALAEKAWQSPKLGKDIHSLSATDLKGKAREDLIRVWWYHVPSPELVFTRKELEEGEIEDEEDLIDGRKESKKEKKARLAIQAKTEKLKKKENAQAAAVTLAKEKQAQLIAASTSTLTTSNDLPSYSGNDASSAISMSPSLQNMYTSMPYSGGLPITQPWLTASPFTSVLPSGPQPITTSLASRYELAPQWRDPHPIASPEPPHIHFSGSAVGFSIDSSVHAGESSLYHEENMDLDETDMEISSPTAMTSTTIPSHDSSADVPPPSTNEGTSLHSNSNPPISTSLPAVAPELYVPIPNVGQSPFPLSQHAAAHRGLPTPVSTPPVAMSHVGDMSASHSIALASLSTPSEPRAMKNAPREPTFTKRSFLARQKDLEERIARTKMESEQSGDTPHHDISTKSSSASAAERDSTPLDSANATSTSLESPFIVSEGVQVVSPSKQAIEDHLRRLVVRSQRKRHADVPALPVTSVGSDSPTPHQANSLDTTVPPASLTLSVDSAADSTNRVSSSTADSTLDDLAVSFIKESIQTIKPTTPSPSTPVSVSEPKASAPQSRPSKSFVDLAARRKQLEYQIAETKRLMNLLATASTKQGRDDIMSKIREISQAVEEGDSASPISTPSFVSAPAPASKYPSFLVQPIQPVRRLWPDCVIDGGILIVSDDEDEED